MIGELIAAFIGYRIWGGWRGALMGVLYYWLILICIVAALTVLLLFLGPQVNDILSEVGNSL